MKRTCALTIAVTLMLSAFIAAQSRSAAEEFKAAQHKETVEGDIKGAIDAYNKIAKSKDREFAARALVAIGDALRRSKDADARTKYQQVIKDFPEQKDAVALAEARLKDLAAAAAQPPALFRTQTLLWSFGEDAPGDALAVSPDGRYLLASYGRTLVEVEAVTRKKRMLGAISNTRSLALSADGERIAFGRLSDGYQGYQLDVLDRNTLNVTPKTLFRSPSYIDIQAFGWNSDNKEVFAVLTDRDYSHQIAAISENGAIRTIQALGWRNPGKLSLSPDGRYIAYDAPVGKQSANRDVFLVSTKGGAEIAIVQDGARSALPVWTPDGGSVMFASDRAGSLGLWIVSLADGNAIGAPRQLTTNESPLWPIGFSRDGLFYYKTVPVAPASDIYTGAVQSIPTDAAAVRPSSTPLASSAPRRNSNPNLQNLQYSPDGKLLGYLASGSAAFMEIDGEFKDSINVVVRSLESGAERRFSTGLTDVTGLRWSADGLALRFEGRTGLTTPYSSRRIDLQTGSQTDTDLPNLGGILGFPCVSPDGKRIYFGRSDSPAGRFPNPTPNPAIDGFRARAEILNTPVIGLSTVIAYDVDTKQETALGTFQNARFSDCGRFLSPDGKYIVVFAAVQDAVKGNQELPRGGRGGGGAQGGGGPVGYLIPTAGGTPGMMSLPGPLGITASLCNVQWSSDRKSVLVTPCGPLGQRGPQNPGGGRNLWRILEGGAPTVVGTVPAADTLTPDVKQFAYTPSVPDAVRSQPQTWVVPDLLQSNGQSHGLFMADFDQVSGKVRGSITRSATTASLTGFERAPTWSPDGNSVVLKRGLPPELVDPNKNRGALVVRSLTTGIETAYPPGYATAWLHAGGLVTATPSSRDDLLNPVGFRGQPNDGLVLRLALRADMKSGPLQEISDPFKTIGRPFLAVSPDDRTLYSLIYGDPNKRGNSYNIDVDMVAVDLGSGRQRTAFTLPPDLREIISMDLSPDGRTFVMRTEPAKADPITRQVVPDPAAESRIVRIQIDGTGYRELFRGRPRIQGLQGLSDVRWTKDGKAVLAAEQVDEETWQIFRIPAEGGAQPVSIGLRVTSRAPVQFDLSPDGTRIVFSGAAATILPPGAR